MKTIKKDECSYSFSNAIRTLAMVGVSLKDLWKSSNINGFQAASKAFIKRETKTRKGAAQSSFEVAPFLCKF